MKLVTAEEVASLLDKNEVLTCLEEVFVELGSGKFTNPPQTSIELREDGGDTIFYPGAHLRGGLIGVTVSPYLFARSRAGLNPVTSFTLLISTESGLPVGLIESEPLIEARTAATTAIAVKTLSSPTDNRLAIVGSGPIARAHLEYALLIRQWEEVSIYSPSIVEETSPRRSVLQRLHPELKFAESLKENIGGANVVMFCTAAAEPICGLNELPGTALITSTTTSGPEAHDVPMELLLASTVYCDSRATTPNIAGEMIAAEREGGWSRSAIVGDLGELLTSKSAAPNNGRRYFRSVGIGSEEISLAKLALSRLPD